MLFNEQEMIALCNEMGIELIDNTEENQMKKWTIIPISENEFTLEANGWSFHICLGSHTSGNYIAIPDWGVCSEASGWSDTFWNEEQLADSKSEIVSKNAESIARAVKEYMS